MASVVPLTQVTQQVCTFKKFLMTMLILLTSCGGDRVNVREETFTVHATVEIKCDYTRELTNQMDIEEEKEKLLDVIAENPEKELMNENFEFIDLIEVD